jgi:chromosomal replication initiation ATPase DnaA
MAENRQLSLELALDPRFGEEDFLVSASNAEAYSQVEIWPDWPSAILLLVGPQASGKSHLTSIWAERSQARQLSARALGKAEIPALVQAGAVAVEDIDADGLDEAALFHLINLAGEKNAFVLLTSGRALPDIDFRVADLASRLRKLPMVMIDPPDDALIRALLVKLFVDRQLVVDTALVDYLCLRMERSFGAVRATVETLDRETLARGKRLTRPMAAQILGYGTGD